MNRRVLAAIASASIGFATAGEGVIRAATVVWDGDTSTDYLDGNNWVGSTPPADSLTLDVADFSGTFTNQPRLDQTVGTARKLNGIITGTPSVTFTTRYDGGPENEFWLGSGGITTGSSTFNWVLDRSPGTGLGSRLVLKDNQTWSIGSGGMVVAASASATSGSYVSVGSGFTLTKAGAGALDLTGTRLNTNGLGKWNFTGGMVTIREQTQLAQNAGSFTSDRFTFDGGTLRIQPTAINEGNLNNANNGITVNSSGGTIEFFTFSTDVAQFNQKLSGAGTLTLRGGTLTDNVSMQANNTGYTGKLILTGNHASVNDFTASANSIAPDGQVQLSAGSASLGTWITFNASTTYNVGALSNTGTARLRSISAANPVVNVNESVSTTYSGSINDQSGGSLSLVKQGTANLTLAANNLATWTKVGSSVTINAGTLTVGANNALGSNNVAVTVNNGGALASDITGRSIANGVTTGGTSSTLDPSGTFTINSLNAAAGARFSMTGNGAADLLDIAATFTKPTSSGGMHFYFFSMTPGTPYNLIDFASPPGILPSDLVVLNAGWVLDTTFGTGAFAGSGWNLTANDVLQVQFSQVPEPAAAGLFGLAAWGFCCRRRRHR